jgi:hypothetical protein
VLSGITHAAVRIDGPTTDDRLSSFTLIRKKGDTPLPLDLSGKLAKLQSKVCLCLCVSVCSMLAACPLQGSFG